MKNANEGKSPRETTPANDPDANEKRKRRLDIQKNVLRKILSPLAEQIQEDNMKEAEIKSKRK